MIDNLLLIARAESPQTRIARDRVDVARELETVREFYQAAAAEASIRLEVNAPTEIDAELDGALFQRAIANLVANALAHTPAGGTITLAARRDGNGVHVEVADTGTGIPPEHLPHVFDRFYRVDAARSRDAGRVGLGLAIVQGIATLHRGSASIASEVGKGTRVCLTFPAAEAKRQGDKETAIRG
jgi:two-component system heavy metal sensor histidine kinase CusS